MSKTTTFRFYTGNHNEKETLDGGYFINKTGLPIRIEKVEGRCEHEYHIPGKKVWEDLHNAVTSEGLMVSHWENRSGMGFVKITDLAPSRTREDNRRAAELFIRMMELAPDPMLYSNPDPKCCGQWVTWLDPGTNRSPDRADRVLPGLVHDEPNGDGISTMEIPWYRQGTVRVRLLDTPPTQWYEYIAEWNRFHEFVGKTDEMVDPSTI